MWIKLISPRTMPRPMDSAMKTQMAPPLSLLVLAGLTPPRHEVTIADENVERVRLDDAPALVGITVKVDTAYRAWEIARAYRRRGIPVVLGGIHPTMCPGDNAPHADAVVIGEAEDLWHGLLADAEAKRLRSLYRAERPPDLARTPCPPWELIAGKNYLYANTLTIGRGCPWRCEFCYNSSPNVASGYRMKPIANILREIESLGTRHVMFIDDNFISSLPEARALLRAMLPLGLTWHTAVSANIGRHEDILDLMAAGGCRSLFIGFESVNPANMAASDKRQNRVTEYAETIRRIHGRGMMVNSSMVFGFDDDGPEVFDRTLAWLIEQRVETMTAHILTPYPGSRLYARLSREGRIIDHDLTHYNTSRAVFRPARMSPAELEEGYARTYRDFYSWSGIVRRMPRDPARRTPYLLFNLLYRKYGTITATLGRLGLMRALGRIGAAWSYPSVRTAAPRRPDGSAPPLAAARG